MQIITAIAAVRSVLQKAKRQNKTIGFVPTMGALHEGHMALIRQSRQNNDVTVVSIFVNPTQFGPREDFNKYPRQIKQDCLLLKKEKVDILFLPSSERMYPQPYLTYINVERLSDTLCGKSRPGHFRGVATIVAKLLLIINPNILYLGQKDAQQCIVIKRMINDLNFNTKVEIVPTVREADGLAKSSRNVYLNPQQRKEAVVLSQSLFLAKRKIKQGTREISTIKKTIRALIQKRSSGKIDYIECVDAQTLMPLKTIKSNTLIALAVRFERTRLIDNIIV